MQEDIELAPSQVESEISVRFMLDGGVITLGKSRSHIVRV